MDDFPSSPEPAASFPPANAGSGSPAGGRAPGEHPATGARPGSVVIERVESELEALEAALGRLLEGAYGSCRRCSAPIPDDVLAADPLAEDCGRCGPGDGPDEAGGS